MVHTVTNPMEMSRWKADDTGVSWHEYNSHKPAMGHLVAASVALASSAQGPWIVSGIHLVVEILWLVECAARSEMHINL